MQPKVLKSFYILILFSLLLPKLNLIYGDDGSSNVPALSDTVKTQVSKAVLDETYTSSAMELTEVNYTAPAITSGEVSGKTITLTFDKALDSLYTPSALDFTVIQNETTYSASAVSIQDTKVILTLDRAVNNIGDVYLSYDPAGDINALRDLEGNLTEVFSNYKLTLIQVYALNYEYDAANRLTYIRLSDGEVIEFSYDKNGNLIKTVRN